jgi:peroxiredoxin
MVYADAKSAKPLKAGDQLPAMAPLQNAKGESVSLAEATKGKTSVVVFYRGGWCPYCNTHLAELAKIQPELTAKGVQIIAISPDSSETVAKQTMEKPLPYTVLSDSKHSAAKAMGVAFAVDAETQGKLKGYGIDLVKASGNSEQILPVPAVFVVNPEGRIAFAHANPDYTKRLSGEEILAAAGTPMPMEGSASKSSTPEGSNHK